MKKQSILTLVALVAILALTSCNKYSPKSVSLKTENDSLNYALGLANGGGIKDMYMKNDSSDKAIKVLMTAIDKAYKADVDKGEIYTIGLQIGEAFKQQKAKGLMQDSTLKFDDKLVKQGLVNALNGFQGGMTPQQAQEYIQKTMMKIQMAKQSAQMPQQQMPQQEAPQQAPQPAK